MGKNNSFGLFGDKLPEKLQQNSSNGPKQERHGETRDKQDRKQNNSEPLKFDVLTKENLTDKIDKANKVAYKIFIEKDSYTQIRKFYDELLSLQKQVKDLKQNKDDESFEKTLPLIYLLKSKAAYAKGRDNIHNTFYEFITFYISNIKNSKNLDDFVLYFEAVLGYLRYYSK